MFGDDNGCGSNNDLSPVEFVAAVYVANELLSTPSYISSDEKKEEKPASGVTVVCVPPMTAEEEASLKALGGLLAGLIAAVVVGLCWLALR